MPEAEFRLRVLAVGTLIMCRDFKADCKHDIIRNMSQTDWTSISNLSVQRDVAHSACINVSVKQSVRNSLWRY